MADESTFPNNKLPVTDERYRIPGTNMFLFSKWSRENVPKADHQFAVGDVVVLTVTVEVLALQRDCDGTALYELSVVGNGWGEESIRQATPEEIANY